MPLSTSPGVRFNFPFYLNHVTVLLRIRHIEFDIVVPF